MAGTSSSDIFLIRQCHFEYLSQIDPNYVKAKYYLGIAYYELGQLDDAIKCFENVRDLARDQSLNFGSVIADQLRKAYNKRWQLKNNEHDQQFKRLEAFVDELVDPLLEHRPDRRQLKQELHDYMKAYNEERKSAKNLPDYLTCQLCYDLFVDPVITPSGITYCRKCIEDNIYKVNHVDPISNDKLEASYLITNRCIREAAITFADDTDWFARSDS
ncbi:hypothetical protein GJ496_002868 [Pomphorhynchus laevis]|nr:hypothetical protein GJ496_002868 [Pomphorhynchus laevis]